MTVSPAWLFCIQYTYILLHITWATYLSVYPTPLCISYTKPMYYSCHGTVWIDFGVHYLFLSYVAKFVSKQVYNPRQNVTCWYYLLMTTWSVSRKMIQCRIYTTCLFFYIITQHVIMTPCLLCYTESKAQ